MRPAHAACRTWARGKTRFAYRILDGRATCNGSAALPTRIIVNCAQLTGTMSMSKPFAAYIFA